MIQLIPILVAVLFNLFLLWCVFSQWRWWRKFKRFSQYQMFLDRLWSDNLLVLYRAQVEEDQETMAQAKANAGQLLGKMKAMHQEYFGKDSES